MKQAALDELERIRNRDSENKLKPEAVVTSAQRVTSPLHDYFEWDDDEAAHKYRLNQASRLIRVAVTILPRSQEKVRAYVSLTSDRPNKGGSGGYRQINEVLASRAMRRELMRDAANELRSFQRKFNRLTHEYEMRRLFVAIREAIEILETEEESEDGE